MKYEIFTEKGIRINRETIDQIIRRFAKVFKIASNNYLSIAFVSSAAIKRLNFKYRKINKVTDVLSFREKDSSERGDSNFLGEIIICYSQALKQAKENKITAREEINQLLAHGLAHLMGYKHRTTEERRKMIKKEVDIRK